MEVIDKLSQVRSPSRQLETDVAHYAAGNLLPVMTSMMSKARERIEVTCTEPAGISILELTIFEFGDFENDGNFMWNDAKHRDGAK